MSSKAVMTCDLILSQHDNRVVSWPSTGREQLTAGCVLPGWVQVHFLVFFQHEENLRKPGCLFTKLSLGSPLSVFCGELFK